MHCLVVAIAVMTVLVPAALGLDCIEPRCADGCKRVNGTDDSCPHCVCQPTSCAATSCPVNSTCIERNGKARCFSKRFCPELTCQKNCYKEESSEKCDICKCPCRTLKCNVTEACSLITIQCFRAPCYPVAECRPKSEVCPVYKLKANCYTRERPGQCDEVVCPCETLKCNASQACALKQVQCFRAPCYPVAECRPKSEVCPMVKLMENCYKREIRGQCDEVVCPCHTVRCTAGTVCRLQNETCKKAPCYPHAACVPVCPTQKPCNIRCSTPLKVDENGCQLCQCS